jgi:CRISPR-associated endonuclease Cas3-HD
VKLDATDPNWPKLLSHPSDDGRNAMTLEHHLLGVAKRARDTTPPHAETAGAESLRDVAELVGLAHDFGKATTMFQTHIGHGSGDEGPSHHARLGGLLAFYALCQQGYDPETCFAGLVAVAKHHGTLPNADSFVSNALEQDATWTGWATSKSAYNGHTVEQARDIEENRPAFARAVMDGLVGDGESWTEFLALLEASRSDADDTAEGSLRDWIRNAFMHEEWGGEWYPDGTLFTGSTYLDELRLYGTLTFADKTHAAGIRANDDRLHADPLETAEVWDYIDQLGTKHAEPETLEARLNAVRSATQAYVGGRQDVDPVTDFLGSKQDVATLTLPTGYGKTLAGLLTAARIREATAGDRIIYALPFTSVIDQTTDVLRRLLRDGSDAADPAMDRRLTAHHHLSESLTLPQDRDRETTDSTDEEFDRAVMLAKSWRAGVTLTTFVQLFESLAGPRNTQSMKLPALYDSVIVIDEPQALPLPWWPLVERLVQAVVDEYGATVVLMTATQPRIIDDDRTFSLLDADVLDTLERDAASDLPDRVEYTFHSTALATGNEQSSVVEYDDAAASLVDSASGTTESVLAVCNTIDSAGELFDAVTTELADRIGRPGAAREELVDIAARFEERILDDDRIGAPPTDEPERNRAAFVRALSRAADEETPAVLYLSTRLRPCDRRFLLTVARELTGEAVPLLVVSTQLVEAGVDVSFDSVFRDFAPLDSIVQAAGRCNRSFERAPDPGRIHVWRLEAPEGATKLPSEAVYARRQSRTDTDLLAKTRSALSGVSAGEVVSESDIADRGVGAYHDLVGDAVQTMTDDNDLRERFRHADGEELRMASLIDSRFSFEVYVCRSNAEYELAKQYDEAERHHEFDRAQQLEKKLADLRVSVPAYRRDSDTAQKLVKLEPLSSDAEKRDATERVLRPRIDSGFFDTRTGVDTPESTVDGRIL